MYSLSDSDDSLDLISNTDNSQKNENPESDSDTTVINFDVESAIQSPSKTPSTDMSSSLIYNFTYSQKSSIYDYKNTLQQSVDEELDSLLKKYSCSELKYKGPSKNIHSTVDKIVEHIDISSDEDLSHIRPTKAVEMEPDDVEMPLAEVSLKYSTPNSANTDNSLDTIESPYKSSKKKPKLSPAEKERKKLEKAAEKERKRLEKVAEKAKKQEEAQQAKMLKQAIAAANKNIKPEECIKFVTVLLDVEIGNESYGGEVLNILQAASITYRLQSQIVPRTVTWTCTVQNHIAGGSGLLQQTPETVDSKEVLILLNWKEVVDLIHDKRFAEYLKSLQSVLVSKKLFLGIYGLKDYFRFQKSQKQSDLKSELSQRAPTTTSKHNKQYKDVPKISRNDLEFALTEAQILLSCCHYLLETSHDVGHLIVRFTKAIAQAPYKLEKYKKQQETEWYVWGDNKDTVGVDKNGNGLRRLWQQQLTSFPLARIEHAEAIANKYPTLSSLMEEYSRCLPGVGETLLQDIPIRRAAGPLTTVRRIGPELSKKIHKYLTSLDGDAVL